MSATSIPLAWIYFWNNTFVPSSQLFSVQPGPELLFRLPVKKTCTCVLIINILGSENATGNQAQYKYVDKYVAECNCFINVLHIAVLEITANAYIMYLISIKSKFFLYVHIHHTTATKSSEDDIWNTAVIPKCDSMTWMRLTDLLRHSPPIPLS